MKAGEEFTCPYCHQQSFLKLVPLMDGWTKKGDALACVSCSGIIEEVKKSDPLRSTQDNTSSADRLKSLLGDMEETEKISLTEKEGDKNFCRDCSYLIAHPFLCRCMKYGKEVNPMDDCPAFEKKKK
ncbi:MAG: hypothetical protein IKA79_00690 [Lentisphaeria bacterium]|nr:hypothetical protein [Lentisphaeria bacterium]